MGQEHIRIMGKMYTVCNSLIGVVDTLAKIKKKKMNTEVQDKGE